MKPLNAYLDELRGLNANNIGSWPQWAQIGAVILACGLLIFMGHRFLIKPKLEELASVEQQELSLRTEFEMKQKKVAALDAYRAQLDEMQRSFGAMLKQLPSKSEVANLLNDVSQTRVAAGLEEDLFQPQSEVTKEFYAELPINIEVKGNYHEMGAFTSDVAALPRIVTIGNVEIRPQDEKGGKAPALAPTASPAGPPIASRLQIKLVAKTYRYLDAEEQAAQDAKTAAAAQTKAAPQR